MPSVKLNPGAVDVRGKDLSEFVGIDFDCYLYEKEVIVRNHITKQTHEVEYKYVTIVKD